jgi:Thrombospondin type 3 repeat
MYSKLLVLFAALALASFIGARPAKAQIVCDPLDPAADCDGDGIPNGSDTCNNLDPAADCDNDGIPNGVDTCNNLDPLADCDGDGVANGVDQCPATTVGGDLVIGQCTLTGFGDTILPTGCSLAESVADTINDCTTPPAPLKPKSGGNGSLKNHGKFVSCVAHATNTLKKAKIITGQQKGQIQSCAAQSDIP